MIANILDYGGVADGVTDNTAAFEKAVAACERAGGGKVFVPSGQFVSGTIELKSNVFLELEPGAEILASYDFSLFKPTKRGSAWIARSALLVNPNLQVDPAARVNPCKALIMAEDAHHVGVIGFGTLDGRRETGKTPKDAGSPYLVVFSNCTDVFLEDVTMIRPGSFTNYLLNCKKVTIRGLHIDSTGTACGDGIDFDGGQDVTISDCIIDAGDDGIGLKTLTPSEPCERFTITNCNIRSKYWGCIRIGPETAADYRFITVSNCVFHDSNDGIKLQLCEDKVFEDFVFSNLTMDRVTRPFFITNTHYPFSIYSNGSRPACGAMRRILFNNITAVLTERRDVEGVGPYTPYSGCLLYSLPSGTIEDVTFSHIRLACLGGGTKEDGQKTDQPDLLDYVGFYPESCLQFGTPPAAAFTLRNAKNIRFNDFSITCKQPDGRCAFAAENVVDLALEQVRVQNTNGLLRQHACDNLLVQNSRGEVVAFTAQQEAAYDQAKADSAQMEQTICAITDLIDGVGGSPFSFNGEQGIQLSAHTQGVLVLPLIDGCFTVELGDQTIAKYDPLPCYRGKTMFACPVCVADQPRCLTVHPIERGAVETVYALFYKE
ncbi:MAG: right-handed parallel beta-helix repeat-containing protein [Clostridia bacterium]|nr:right-handed parallel beta-helix repeat-containing protein [Clostridia bacterium]